MHYAYFSLSAPSGAPKAHLFMYSEPSIHIPANGGRSYVEVYIDGERHRLYNGKALGIKCNPNRSKPKVKKEKELTNLVYELRKNLEKGWRPNVNPAKPRRGILPAGKAFELLKDKIEQEDISDTYKRDLLAINDDLLSYLTDYKLGKVPVGQLDADYLEEFLQRYATSTTNHMNKRRTLSALFLRLNTYKILKGNPTQETQKQKVAEPLNMPFRKDKIKEVLQRIKERHPKLYLCCLLMYGCLLRPHQEVRQLRRGSFDETLSKISLGGRNNKSRRNRTVLVPEYVQAELKAQGVHILADDMNIFSGTGSAYNKHYFSTAWGRVAEQLLKKGLITKEHTLYSFRDTAAVEVYLKTKDPFKVQKAMGHSSLRVTLVYLRSLGLIIDTSLDDLPELPV